MLKRLWFRMISRMLVVRAELALEQAADAIDRHTALRLRLRKFATRGE
jgi:hypothetical protein